MPHLVSLRRSIEMYWEDMCIRSLSTIYSEEKLETPFDEESDWGDDIEKSPPAVETTFDSFEIENLPKMENHGSIEMYETDGAPAIIEAFDDGGTGVGKELRRSTPEEISSSHDFASRSVQPAIEMVDESMVDETMFIEEDEYSTSSSRRRGRVAPIVCLVCLLVLVGIAMVIVGVARAGNGNSTTFANALEGAPEGNSATLSPMPSTSPEESTVQAPSPAPSPTPSDCSTTLSVDKLCYPRDDDIIVFSFSQCEPNADDWIGIYLDDGTDAQALGDDYVSWVYACGTRSCQDPTHEKTLHFDGELPAGTYRIFLVRDNPIGAPYTSGAASESFEIGITC